MLVHLAVNVRDLAQAKAYYDVLMPLLGFEPIVSGPILAEEASRDRGIR